MKNVVRATMALLLAAIPAVARAQASPAEQAAMAYALEGVLYLAAESGRVVQTIRSELPIGDFAISPDLKTVVFSLPHPGESGGPLLLLNVTNGGIEPVKPDPYFNDDSVTDIAAFYSDPDFSPDGKYVVFATHAAAEGSEVQMSGPLAILDVSSGEIAILGSTVGESGLPLGYLTHPRWSPDGKRILANIEGLAFVTDAEGRERAQVAIPESELSQSAQSYGMHAIGWLGSGCVLYQAGEDPGRDPARIATLRTGRTAPAATMLRLPEASLRGVSDFAGRLRARPDPEGFRIEGPDVSWLIRGDAETTYVRLLPPPGDQQVPDDCK
jgi:hypothetical protein